MNGYAGKLLFADLTEGKIWEEELTEELANNYLGLYGLGRIVQNGVDPGMRLILFVVQLFALGLGVIHLSRF